MARRLTGDACAAVEIATPLGERPDRVKTESTQACQKRHSAKYKLDRQYGRETSWGRPKSPISTPAPTAPASTASAASPRSPTSACSCALQAEAEGLLRQPDRKAVQPHLQRGCTPQGQHLEKSIPVALLESRLDAIVYRAKFVPTPFAARSSSSTTLATSWSTWQAGQHPVLPREGGRRGCRCASARCNMALVRWKALQLAERDTPDYVEVDAQHGDDAKYTCACAELAEVPYPVKMEPNPGGRVLRVP